MTCSDVPLIPRKVLFGDPDRASVQISPDGKHLAWLAPLDGVLNVWVAPRDDLGAARPVTHDMGRGIRYYLWAYTNAHILCFQDKDGDENWRMYAVDLTTNEVEDLTPFEGVQAQLQEVSYKTPTEVVLGLNNRDPKWHDVYRLNIVTGEMTLLVQHDRFAFFVVDGDCCVRLATQVTPDGVKEIYAPASDEWRLWDTIPLEDTETTWPLGFDKANRLIFMMDSRGRDTAAVVEINLETKEKRVLATDPQADVCLTVQHPTEKHVQAVASVYDRKRWQVLDAAIQPDFDTLQTVSDGEMDIVSRTLDDRFWVVFYELDDGPGRYYLYDRRRRNARFLFTNRQALEGQPLVKMHSTVIKSRDGIDLVTYYSLPPGSDTDNDGIPDEPVPMVLMPHGGPWWRDSWGYNGWHQWLANRGYALLNVNFRASWGFGKAFLNAGDYEMGGKVIEDQVDAVQWAIKAGIADARRVAILGGSFGGYSTLAGMTFTPELYVCGVDIFGISNLITFLESVPSYWKPMLDLWTKRFGDHRTEEGRALLRKHSPLTYVDRICRPLLIGQGANDVRVTQAESDQIVEAMQVKNIPVTYVLYPDEGHGFARPENRTSFNAIAEVFLAQCLGGRCEPIGDDLNGSSLQVLAGAEDVAGLQEALDALPAGATAGGNRRAHDKPRGE
jgi:dipeptidyl aminopeptidase/acylaminoacyl peptidase